jgi:hypothetical protein
MYLGDAPYGVALYVGFGDGFQEGAGNVGGEVEVKCVVKTSGAILGSRDGRVSRVSRASRLWWLAVSRSHPNPTQKTHCENKNPEHPTQRLSH